MSGALDLSPIRKEVAGLLSRVAAHAAAGAVHAEAGTNQMLTAEVRCAAASLMAVAGLVEHLRPSRQQQGGPAA
ncbi:hypothetical protein MPAR168_15480 [Methylorubrum populi]|uniref:Uncharacterized protein n=1 Tax=Methylobacterium radiotolerans TaxID=31998 RepID=A0ABU7T7V1_9HYPH